MFFFPKSTTMKYILSALAALCLSFALAAPVNPSGHGFSGPASASGVPAKGTFSICLTLEKKLGGTLA